MQEWKQKKGISMKILICYFSGTGNTQRVVYKFKEALCEKGAEVDVYRIESNEMNFNLDDYDKVGIAYPVHAFNAPAIVLDFAKKLPELKYTKPLFILNTSGEPLKLNNISSIKLKKILGRKNYDLTNEYHYVMPYNIIFRHTDKMAYDMWETAQKVIPIDAEELLSGKTAELDKVLFGSLLAFIFRVEHWGGRFNGKRYKVNENCCHCNACTRMCPTHNITVENGELKFGKNCIMCMRCSFFCKENAIKIGLFEKWKVNGPYTFEKPKVEEENKHKNYCKKSYIKYFANCEEKIKKYENLKKQNFQEESVFDEEEVAEKV